MLNKGKAEKEKSKKEKSRSKMVFYILLLVMLFLSFTVKIREDSMSVEAGGFGTNKIEKNTSFSDLAEKVFGGGRFEEL